MCDLMHGTMCQVREVSVSFTAAYPVVCCPRSFNILFYICLPVVCCPE